MRRSRDPSNRRTKAEIPVRPLASPKRRLTRLLIVLAGVIVGQSLIYGPCLIGQKILLPIDTLASSYLPRTDEVKKIQEWDHTLTDIVRVFEPARRFAAREFRAGRLPLWTPDYFAGAPCIWSIFSPFSLLECLTESPVIVAWKALATALVAGLGMYCFCRRAVRVGFWPACISAWCYPVTGFFVIWQGFIVRQTVCALPWLLLAVDGTVRGKSRFAPIGLGLVTGLVAVGQLDIAGQVLLVSGLYSVWCLWDEYGQMCFLPPARRAVVRLTCGWILGLMLAAPQALPGLEYAKTGSRLSERGHGEEERPPAGLIALPHIFLPDYYGRTTRNSLGIVPYEPGNLQESAVGAYAGVLAMLFAAPLAFWSRPHRSMNLFFLGLAFLGVSWLLKVPIIVDALRLPGLNMMSHNRLALATSFAACALAAVGLDALAKGGLRWRWWHCLLAIPLAGLSGLCIYRALVLPEPVASLSLTIARGGKVRWVEDLKGAHQVQVWFFYHSLVAGIFCAAGVILWLVVGLKKPLIVRWLFPLASLALVTELLWFAQKWQPQCDPKLYYPPVPALEQAAAAKPGRVIGYGYLPPNLASMAGLRDIRGYNGVDPAILMELLATSGDPRGKSPSYARTQNLVPKTTTFANGDVRLPAVLDLLGVRYLIFQGEPYGNAHPLFKSFDYYVIENTNALPRTFVPRRVECAPNHDERLRKLQSPDFYPRQIAFVESTIELPDDCRGDVEVRNEIPTRVTLQARMETAGLVVLADIWDKGWQAYLNGQRTPILRTNHALRGVVVPAGNHTLEFRYEPASLALGLWLAAVAALTLLGWAGIGWRANRLASKLKDNAPERERDTARSKPVKSGR